MLNTSFDSFVNSVSSNQSLPKSSESKKYGNDFNNQKIKPLENDKVELSKNIDKKSKIKKGFLVGTGVGLAAIGIVSAVCLHKTNKIKKEITKIYDATFDIMAQEAKRMNINFEKPKLLFKTLGNTTAAETNIGQGSITINKKILRRRKVLSPKGNSIWTVQLPNGNKYYQNISIKPANMLKPKNARYLTYEEYMLEMASTVRHELTHARQEQFLLSSENGLERFFEACKKTNPEYKDVTFEEFIKYHPFYAKYKPKQKIPLSRSIVFSLPFKDGAKKYGYNSDDVIKGFSNYSIEKDKYYTNMLEIEARIEEYRTAQYLKQVCPDLEIPDDVVETFKLIRENNIASLVNPKAN